MSKYIEIQEQIARLKKEADEIMFSERNNAIQEILTKMDAFGITTEDLDRSKGRAGRKPAAEGKSTGSGTPAPIKYRGPNGETWTGRGLMPRWLAALVAQGQTREQYAV
jgi:DNA-binding protein H-NS